MYGCNSTTSVLTATILIYAIGAGITAAAGTETCPPIDTRCDVYIALIPIADTEWYGIDISCHCLPVLGLGNLRACCLPWMW